jgi:hypothetical protein
MVAAKKTATPEEQRAERTLEVVSAEHERVSAAIRRGAEQLSAARQDLAVCEGEEFVATQEAVARGQDPPDSSRVPELREKANLLERQIEAVRKAEPALRAELRQLEAEALVPEVSRAYEEMSRAQAEEREARERASVATGRWRELEYRRSDLVREARLARREAGLPEPERPDLPPITGMPETGWAGEVVSVGQSQA